MEAYFLLLTTTLVIMFNHLRSLITRWKGYFLNKLEFNIVINISFLNSKKKNL